jgi:hypothetical protein
MRKTLGVCLLILLLTGSAHAGLIPNESPAPPPPSAAQDPALDGIMPNGSEDSLTQTVLDPARGLAVLNSKPHAVSDGASCLTAAQC